MKFKRSIPYQILIDPTPNGGFIVTVGCVKVVYSDPTALLRDLTAYLQNPEDVEKQYNLDIGKLDRVHIGPFAPALHSILPQEPVVYSQRRKEL